MVEHVRRSFSEILQELPWLEDSTKKVAQEKVCTTAPVSKYQSSGSPDLPTVCGW